MSTNLPAPRISCVVPCLDAEQHLEAALDALLSTASPEDEIIAVYDKSTDQTRQILARFEPRVKTIDRATAEPHGAARAINCGFAASTGDILCWLGTDDYVFPWTFKVVREVFAQHPEIKWITSTQPCVVRGNSVMAGRLKGFSKSYFLDGFSVPGMRRGAGWMQQESTFWRRELWDKAGGRLNTDVKIAFDLDLWARFFAHASPCGVDTLMGAFRYRDGQLSGNIPALASEAGQILNKARLECGWRRGFLRELLILAGHKQFSIVKMLALKFRPYKWTVARAAGGRWNVETEKFWIY